MWREPARCWSRATQRAALALFAMPDTESAVFVLRIWCFGSCAKCKRDKAVTRLAVMSTALPSARYRELMHFTPAARQVQPSTQMVREHPDQSTDTPLALIGPDHFLISLATKLLR
jgi:hypothetical protein